MATVWEERVEMRDPSRKEDAKNLGIVYGTGAVAALLTAALLLKASPAPVMEVLIETAPDPAPIVMRAPAAEPVVQVQPAPISGDNRLYGTVTTLNGRRYEGYIRWDRNEGSWADLLDANKQPDHGNGRVVRVRRVREQARGARERAREVRENGSDAFATAYANESGIVTRTGIMTEASTAKTWRASLKDLRALKA